MFSQDYLYNQDYSLVPKMYGDGMVFEIMGERNEDIFHIELVFDKVCLREIAYDMETCADAETRLHQLILDKVYEYNKKTELLCLAHEILNNIFEIIENESS